MSEKERVLLLQQSLDNPVGRVGAMLDEYDISYQLIHVGRDQLPDPGGFQALIVLGGSRHVAGKHKQPYTVHDEASLHQAIKQGIPYLGMGLGGQLLAQAFQAPVKKLPKVHIGFVHLHLSEAGKKDPLYKNVSGSQQAFHWHENCFLLPKGAVALAQLSDGFNQAFLYGQRAYGLQYHIEVSEEMLDTWLHDASQKIEFINAYGSEAYRKVEQEALDLFPTYAKHASIMLRNFFRLSELI